MDTEGPRDVAVGLSPLERLPPELLASIFDQIAYSRKPMNTSGLSRTLLPYVRRRLYRHLRFLDVRPDPNGPSRSANFLEFCETTKDNPELVGMVESLDIYSGTTLGLQEMKSIYRFFKLATAIKHLYIGGRLRELLSVKFALLYRSVELLDIHSLRLSDSHPLSHQLRNLSLLPKLRRLHIDSCRSRQDDAREAQGELHEDDWMLQVFEKGAR